MPSSMSCGECISQFSGDYLFLPAEFSGTLQVGDDLGCGGRVVQNTHNCQRCRGACFLSKSVLCYPIVALVGQRSQVCLGVQPPALVMALHDGPYEPKLQLVNAREVRIGGQAIQERAQSVRYENYYNDWICLVPSRIGEERKLLAVTEHKAPPV
eukprot:2021096-Amphidinium_carterae.1